MTSTKYTMEVQVQFTRCIQLEMAARVSRAGAPVEWSCRRKAGVPVVRSPQPNTARSICRATTDQAATLISVHAPQTMATVRAAFRLPRSSPADAGVMA